MRSDDNLDFNNSSPKNFLKNHVNSIIFLLLLTVIVSIITYYRILVQIELGPVYDSFVFLANALVFSGHSIGYSDLLRPPFFSFIISLLFRLGYTSANTIFVVDGILFVFGVIGMFMLLKIRFNDLESFLGGLIYATFPIVLIYLGFGFSDLASVSFSIWAIYFMILAFKKDSRFFYLAFPFFMFAFLTRYNNGLLIFPVFLYILINSDKINFKNLIIGIIASFLVLLPVLIFFYEKFGNIIYPLMSFGSTSTAVSISTETASYNPNIFYFLQMLPVYIGLQGKLIVLIVALGIVLCLILRILRIKDNKYSFEGLNLKSRNSKIKLVLFIILIIAFLVSFGKTVYMVSEVLFFALAYLFYEITRSMKIKKMDLHVLFFSWFMVFFIFSSIFVIKDDRYFLLMAPPVVYFMILGLSEISNIHKFKIKNNNVIFPVLTIILTLIILFSNATLIPTIRQANNGDLIANQQIEMASQWFVNYDPNYKNQNIYSDLSPNFSWYLNTNVKQIPVFKNNQTFIGVNNDSFTQEDSNEFNNYLVTNNADYYFCIRNGLNLTSYKPIKQFGNVIIYKRE